MLGYGHGRVIALVFMAACLNGSQFENQYAEEYCKRAQDCEVLDIEGFSTLSSCESETSSLPEDCEEFSSEQGKKCLKQLRASTCQDAMDGPPKSCSRICEE